HEGQGTINIPQFHGFLFRSISALGCRARSADAQNDPYQVLLASPSRKCVSLNRLETQLTLRRSSFASKRSWPERMLPACCQIPYHQTVHRPVVTGDHPTARCLSRDCPG